MRRLTLCTGRKRSKSALPAMALLSIFCSAEPACAADSAVTVTAGNLPAAVSQLVSRYSAIITLEIPRYVYAGDYEDMPAQFRSDVRQYRLGAAPKMLRARLNPVALTVPASTQTGVSGAAPLLSQLVDGQAKSDHGAHYRTLQVGNVVHIVPFEIRDKNGNWAPTPSIFDTLVSLPKEERSILETVLAVCAQVGASAQVPVDLVQYPKAMLANTHTTMEARGEPARDVLMRAISALPQTLTWRSVYNQTVLKHFLVIYRVPDAPSPADAAPIPASIAAPSRSGGFSAQSASSIVGGSPPKP